MDEPRFQKIEATPEGGLKMTMAPGELLQMFVEAMKTNLQEHDAPNYVESEFVDRNTGERWTLLVQRVEGLTPGHKAHLAEMRYESLDAHFSLVKKKIMAALGDGSNEQLWKPGTAWYDAAADAIGRLESLLH
jgi:hypothetical protein